MNTHLIHQTYVSLASVAAIGTALPIDTARSMNIEGSVYLRVSGAELKINAGTLTNQALWEDEIKEAKQKWADFIIEWRRYMNEGDNFKRT